MKDFATQPQAEVREPRLERSRDEAIDVEYIDGPRFRVVNHDSESEYVVNVEERTCTCPDFKFRNVTCKHLYRLVDELIGPEGAS